MHKWILNVLAVMMITATSGANACPSGQSKGAFGWCYPNIGGDVGSVWEKGKRDVAGFAEDVKVWIATGKCGGDFCDAFAAAVSFVRNEATDFSESLKRAGQRLNEGKPLDAVWHLHTDYLQYTQQNTATAVMSSRVLMATGQVAASVYGGAGGSAAYTAWLTYNTTGRLEDALRAGVISGLSAAALSNVGEVKLEGTEGIAARAVLTGAINGAAVALSGGSQEDIRAAAAMGVVTVLIREGYRQLTEADLDNKALRSSTGEAYCLAEVPDPSYVMGTETLGCFGPPSAYTLENGKVKLGPDGKTPAIKFTELEYGRPHVGAMGKAGSNNPMDETSGVMTGFSRLPGWNAMAVAHDKFSIDMRFDVLPGGLSQIPTIGTIPPAMVLTYMGTGYQIHESIRNTFTTNQKRQGGTQAGPSTAVQQGNSAKAKVSGVQGGAPFGPKDVLPFETLHVLCLNESSDVRSRRTDIIVNVAADGNPRGNANHLCEVRQQAAGYWFELGHAHHELNYCHRVAERIAKSRLSHGYTCMASTGLQSMDSVARAGE